jgi:hypothetical protein
MRMHDNRYDCFRETISKMREANADSDFIAISMHDICAAGGTAETRFGLHFGTGESGERCWHENHGSPEEPSNAAASIGQWTAKFRDVEPSMPIVSMLAAAEGLRTVKTGGSWLLADGGVGRLDLTVIDIGCNLGHFSRRCADLWPSATVYCVEPVPASLHAGACVRCSVTLSARVCV